MTPMQKLKNNLALFKEFIGEGFKEIDLNKAHPKEHINVWYPDLSVEKKGVKADFIRIYSAKFNKEDSYSLAFEFTYIDIPENEQTIQFSIKAGSNNDYLIQSKEFSVNEFKEKLNQVNHTLLEKEGNFTRQELIETLLLEFIPKQYDNFKKQQRNNFNTNLSKQLKKTIR